jgi:hypothetical protein
LGQKEKEKQKKKEQRHAMKGQLNQDSDDHIPKASHRHQSTTRRGHHPCAGHYQS